MKFLKQKTLSKFTPNDQALFTNQYGRAVMNLHGGLRLPKGTTAERPQGTKAGDGPARTLGGTDGFIRYNTSTSSIEAYVGGAWEVVRAPGATAVTIQTIGPGDDTWTVTPVPLDIVPASPNNLIVLIENVIQIPVTNFTLLYNYLGVQGDTRILFMSEVPTDKNVTVFFGFAN
jgi:hypothetical protein